MNTSGKTDPSKPRKRPSKRRPPANGRRPAVRTMHEDVEVTDSPLYRPEPDRKLQHRTLQWVGLTFTATLACVGVVAIVQGSVPTPLVAAALVLATALMVIVRNIFPRLHKRSR